MKGNAKRSILHAALLWANLAAVLAQVCTDGNDACASPAAEKGTLAMSSSSLLQRDVEKNTAASGWENNAPMMKEAKVLAEAKVKKNEPEGEEEDEEEDDLLQGTAETWCSEGCKPEGDKCTSQSGLARDAAMCLVTCKPKGGCNAKSGHETKAGSRSPFKSKADRLCPTVPEFECRVKRPFKDICEWSGSTECTLK